MKISVKSQLLCLILLLWHFSPTTCKVDKSQKTSKYKNEFSKFKQLFQYNLEELTNNYKRRKIQFDKKVLNKLSPQEKSILKEFHRINGNQNETNLNEYLKTVQKYENLKDQMRKHKNTSQKKSKRPKRQLKVSITPKKPKLMKKPNKTKHKPRTTKKRHSRQNPFTPNEAHLFNKLYHIKHRILESNQPAPRKLPAKAVQKGNRVWGGATYVKLGQEHAPVYIDQSPSYLYSAPKFKTNQNGVELPLPDRRAFSPKQIPIAATFGTRPDDLNTKFYGDADEYKYQGQPKQAIDVEKAWTLPQPGFMPLVQKYPANQRQLIQIDSPVQQKGDFHVWSIWPLFLNNLFRKEPPGSKFEGHDDATEQRELSVRESF